MSLFSLKKWNKRGNIRNLGGVVLFLIATFNSRPDLLISSFLFLPQDFLTPHLKMFTDKNFGKLGVNIDLTVPVVNMESTGYGMKTQSIDVLSGV